MFKKVFWFLLFFTITLKATCNVALNENHVQVCETHQTVVENHDGVCCVQDNEWFITTWQTSTANESITIPTTGSGYNYTVDWGDGNVTSGHNGNATHTYSSAGDYTVKIAGDFPRIYFNNSGDKDKIISINQWGTGVWTSMQNAFYGCTNLDSNAIVPPNLSNVTDTRSMFYGASAFNQDIGNWDVSHVTKMDNLFRETSFNQDIGDWNVSNVTNMFAMFYHSTSFNQDISDWNVSHVTSMRYMFDGASSFNQDIGNWNVGNVTDMMNMFNGASVFNQDISNWNVSNVTRMDYMFKGASSFNQDIGNWNVSNVTNMNDMFYSASVFNQNISNWDVSHVTSMSNMLRETSFNQDIGDWNVSNVTNMFAMFYHSTSFNQDISDWNVSKVTSFNYMLDKTAMSTSKYDNLLTKWDNLNLQNNQTLGAKELYYCKAESARQTIIDNDGWTINDAGLDPNCNICDRVTDVNQTECEALVALYNDTNGTNWTNDENWTTSTTVGDWYGVRVDNGHVTRLTLDNNNLDGAIPSLLGTLSQLDFLYLRNNNLTGSIPNEIGNLSKMRYLYLNDNQLTGSIPSSLGNLTTKLEHIYLYNNKLTGSIPVEIGAITNLKRLNIYNNELNGTIPTEIENLSNLEFLQIDDNNLTGSIPSGIANLSNLQRFTCHDNNLSGIIPTGLKDIASLSWLQFHNNHFVFSDFETEHNTYTNLTSYIYKDQKKVDSDRDVNFIVGGTLTITPEVAINPSGNDSYQWYKDNTIIAGATDRNYTKPNATNADAGVYTYKMTNSVVSGLTLESNQITVSTTAPVADYHFDACSWDGTANEVIDSSGNNHHGTRTQTDVSNTTGVINNAASFPNENTIADIHAIDTGVTPMDIGNQGSISFWFKSNNTWDGGENRTLMDASKGDKYFFISLLGNGKIRFYAEDDSDHDLQIQSNDDFSFAADTWVHLTFTWNLGVDYALYVNGVQKAITLIDNSYPLNGTAFGGLDTIHIGDIILDYVSTERSNSANGAFDEVKFFNVELSSEQIKDIHDNEKIHKNYDGSTRLITDCGGAFITTWQTTTAAESITIPTTGSGYNYTVDWGDGNVTSGHDGNATHLYSATGNHTVKIVGDFPSIKLPLKT